MTRFLQTVVAAAFCLALPQTVLAIGQTGYVETTTRPGSFPLVQTGVAAPVLIDPADWAGVLRAARDLQADVNRVTGLTPALVTAWNAAAASRDVVIIGTIGKSPLIDRLVRDKKLDVSSIAGKWESFFLQTVSDPLPGVSRAVVIAGTDKRGTIYGI